MLLYIARRWEVSIKSIFIHGVLVLHDLLLTSQEVVDDIVVFESLVQFSGFSEFGGENPQISLKFGANRANT
jgi:hypothetical protein